MKVEIYEPWEWSRRLARVVHGIDGETGDLEWLNAQRAASRRGRLKDSQLKLAADAGVRLRKDDGEFERACVLWSAYQQVHGSGTMPAGHTPLGAYLRRQRRLHRKGRLSVDRIARFDALGMPWRLSDALAHDAVSFQRFVQRLEQHCARTGSRTIAYDQVGLGRCSHELYDLAYAAVYAARFGLLSHERTARLARAGLVVVRPEDGEFSVWRIGQRTAA